tara:strand:+ start:199 stop:552 length:354 start_codon:yes stop_codon:yes gene_type:complete
VCLRRGGQPMAYECKVYDKNGKLKKIVKESQITKSGKEIFNQPSTKKISSFIKSFKEPNIEINKGTKFYNKICVVCNTEFYPRHPNSKYCSHECQKNLYLEKKKAEKKSRKKKGNPG